MMVMMGNDMVNCLLRVCFRWMRFMDVKFSFYIGVLRLYLFFKLFCCFLVKFWRMLVFIFVSLEFLGVFFLLILFIRLWCWVILMVKRFFLKRDFILVCEIFFNVVVGSSCIDLGVKVKMSG